VAGDPGFPGDANVLSIGGIAASGTDFENTFIGGIYGASVNSGTALPVYVDTDGHLGTTLVIADGQKVRMRAPTGAQPQAKLKDFQKQEKRIAELEATVARLAATVKEQAAQIQKVSAQVQMSKSAARVVVNNR
jgi:glyoxylate carboligase